MENPESIEQSMDRLVSIINSYRLRFGTEAALQNDLASILVLEHVEFEREFPIGTGRIDFYSEFRIGIECKVDGGPSEVARQLLEYADHELIDGLILVSRRNTHAMREETLRGKPFRYVWVGGSSL